MDKITWRDADVARWFDDHALAVQVDVDAEADLARKLEIRAMPTVIAFKDAVRRRTASSVIAIRAACSTGCVGSSAGRPTSIACARR